MIFLKTNLKKGSDVMSKKNENINADGAKAFQEWIVSDETQKLIGEYGQEEYGEALFIPNAK